MKILGLTCGRKMGNSEVLVREALMGAREAGADTEIIRLFDLNIKPCIGCEKCVYDRFEGGEGGCIIKNDDVPFLIEKIMENDGIIVGAPCYSSRPPAYLLMIQDRFLGLPVRHRKKIAEKQLAKGVIAVGGSDMVGVMLPFLNRCPGGGVGKLVEQMMVIWTSRPDQIVLNEEAVARARKLGQSVAKAAKLPTSDMKFMGDAFKKLDDFTRSDYYLMSQITPFFEACPVCHSDLVRLRGKTVECPMCYMKGTMEIKNGVPTFVCDPVNRPSPYAGPAGRKRHDDEGIRKHNTLIIEKKSEIKSKMKKYMEDIKVIKP
ncbi:MAG: flavodoxin family protein [Chloroflexota bacterium]